VTGLLDATFAGTWPLSAELLVVWSAILKAVLAKRAFAGLACNNGGVDEAEGQKVPDNVAILVSERCGMVRETSAIFMFEGVLRHLM